tara:strand:- start:1171 stop:1575 length:405 start_codon:yes stop_codon:yes gene_type:complete
MEVQKTRLVKIFSEQCEELYLDLSKVYPENVEIKTGLTLVQTMKRFNPKLMISRYKKGVNDDYYDKIVKGDVSFFLNKDYSKDVGKFYDSNEVKEQTDWIDSLKSLYIEASDENKKKLLKYFQNFSKICRMYYS